MTNLIDTAETYQQVVRAIDLLSQGYTLTRACKDVGMSVMLFNRTVKKDNQLAELFGEASQVGYDNMADALLSMSTMIARFDVKDEKELKIMSENIKWYLSKRDQKRFGDKVTIENHITADRAIVDALARGQERALARIEKSKAEDVDFHVVSPVSQVPDDDTENFEAFI